MTNKILESTIFYEKKFVLQKDKLELKVRINVTTKNLVKSYLPTKGLIAEYSRFMYPVGPRALSSPSSPS